jgi:NADPH:quinone reductase-like Zn-dependent oxidoreductase
MTTSKRIIATRTGGPEVLRLESYAPAAPASGEVLVQNQAVGVAFADVLLREGLYPGHRPPIVPGYEVVGRVSAIGADVTGLAVGDYVAALTVVGGYASEVIVPAADLVPVPEALAPEKAAALVLNGLTAYQMLTRCCPADLSSIAVFGAGGGVGSILLDLAKHRGLTTYGFGSRERHPAIAAKGAIPLDRDDPVRALRALAPKGVSAVFDGVGGSQAQLSYDLLEVGGTLVLFGVQGVMARGRRHYGKIAKELLLQPRWSALSILMANRGLVGYEIASRKRAHPNHYRRDLATVFALATARVLQPVIDRVYDLAEAPLAHARINDGHHTGKIVLRIGR